MRWLLVSLSAVSILCEETRRLTISGKLRTFRQTNNAVIVAQTPVTVVSVPTQPDQMVTLYDYTTPSYTCPTGFEPYEDLCFRAVLVTPSIVCPDGMGSQGDGTCVRSNRINAVFECPQGYTHRPADDNCVTQVYEPKTFQCPQGYEYMDNRCVKPITTKGSWTCPDNSYVLASKTCQKLLQTQADYACDPQYTLLRDGTCGLITQPICSTPNTVLSVPPGQTVASCVPIASDKAVATVKSSSAPECNKGSTLIDNLCVSNDRRKAFAHCAGVMTGSSTCLTTDYAPALQVCPQDFVVSSVMNADGSRDCEGYLVANLILGCGEGYAEEANYCTTQRFASKEARCPTGFNVLHNQICEFKQVQSVVNVCPDGFELAPTGELCGRMEYSDRIPSCVGDWEFDGATKNCYCPMGECQAPAVVVPTDPTNPENGSETENPVDTGNNNGGNGDNSGGNNNGGNGNVDLDDDWNVYGSGTNTGTGTTTGTTGTTGGVYGVDENVQVVDVVIPAAPPRTIYYPQYVVIPAGDKKSNAQGGGVRVITPTFPGNDMYQPTGLEGTYVSAPGIGR